MNTEQMEEIKRHFGVVAESLRSDIRQVAEGHATIRQELQSLRGEFRDEFKEMRALMRLSFSQLDQRIHTLESDIANPYGSPRNQPSLTFVQYTEPPRAAKLA